MVVRLALRVVFSQDGQGGRNPMATMTSAGFGQIVGNEFGDTIGGYLGYGMAAAQCGTQFLGQSFANSGGGMLMHF
ncbi:hypothetical protein [Bartonella sp. MU70NMGDW]|uniref:hypothetical protein n=2 Tax=unclassified Bartonella TaxID=2645622 RepID=UPI0035CF15C5